MTLQLKPCPFCGGKAHLVRWKATFYPYDDKFRGSCEKCFVLSNHFKAEQEAVDARNRRSGNA